MKALLATRQTSGLQLPSPGKSHWMLAMLIPAIAAAGFADVPKKVVNSAEDLPRRTYSLAAAPSALVEDRTGAFAALQQAVKQDLLTDLAEYDIRDKSTMQSYQGGLLAIAMLEGDYATGRRLVEELRALEEKESGRQMAGLISLPAMAAREAGGSEAEQREAFRRALDERLGRLEWAVVQDNLKSTRGQMQIARPDLMTAAVRNQLDPAAAANRGVISRQIALGLIGIRNSLENTLPFREEVVTALSAVIAAHDTLKPDLWTKRLVTLPPDAPASPVVVGIWDSGTDVSLFKERLARGPDGEPGIAFTMNLERATGLLHPLGEAAPRWPMIENLIKGFRDLQAAVDSPEAAQLRQTMAELRPDQLKQFQEELGLGGLYIHGTHVAGIALEGNPFARLVVARMEWDHRVIPQPPTEESSQRLAAAYQEIVDYFRASGARVVNMSWRYGARMYESMLEMNGIGSDAAERKRIAAGYFTRERDALKRAFESAPEILFVAGSGNEDNDASFEEYIPAGFDLPNLITAGAVDQAGEETSFSSFGQTVVVHANGFEIDSYFPGGRRVKLSGTSMASPQVANLAAKLFALDPTLTPEEVKGLILAAAERSGRVNWIHPANSVEALKQRRR
jgi:hypothetical protein